MALGTLSTLVELIRFNSVEVNPAEITDILNAAPVLSRLNAMPSSNGTVHKFNKETTAPTVGFRAANAGLAVSASVSTQVSVDLKFLDAKVVEDIAIANGYMKGPEAFMDNRTRRNLRQALYWFERQVFRGTAAGDSGGFSGLQDATTLDALADTMVVNATGTTVGGGSSVYMIYTSPDDDGMSLVGQGDGSGNEVINIGVGETYRSLVVDGSGNPFEAYVRTVGAYLGIQIGSAFAVGRICNLTTQTGKGLTDSLLSQCYEKFPANMRPTLIAMNKQSAGQLQRSRTTYSPTGTEAPWPREWQGIPIVETDAIGITETLVA